MKQAKPIIKAMALSFALVGGVAFVITAVTPDVSWAGNGKGNGGGNGGGKGGGNGADKGKGGDKQKADRGKNKSCDKARGNGGSRGKNATKAERGGKKGASKKGGRTIREFFGLNKKAKTKQQRKTRPSTSAKEHHETVESATKKKGNKFAQELGVHPSELGALNAANASWTALENAAPNSRVGRIKAYADEVFATRELEDDLSEVHDLLDALDEPTRPLDEVEDDLSAAEAEQARLETEIKDLQDALEETEDANEAEEIEEKIAENEAALDVVNDDIATLDKEITDGEAYYDAEDEVARLEDEIATQTSTQREALEAAANKEVNDEVEIAVQKLLGIYEEPDLEDEEMAEADDDIVEGTDEAPMSE